MSSNEEDYHENGSQVAKKRKVQRACDICRRKKIRCDEGETPGHPCSNCIAFNFKCTYVEAAKKRGISKRYVEGLETRVEKLEKVLTKLFPDSDILKELDTAVDIDAWLIKYLSPDEAPKPDSNGRLIQPSREPWEIATSVVRNVTQPVEYQSDEDEGHVALSDMIKRINIGDTGIDRFFGKSSGPMFVRAAMELKNEYTGGNVDVRRPVLSSRREEFWVWPAWERFSDNVTSTPVSFSFPAEDLMMSLISTYFDKVNILLPLLHRPSFDKSIAEGLHLQEEGFGTILLLVCAVASRYSDDPRVLLNGDGTSLNNGGWKWFHQVQQVKRSVLALPSLYDLQYYCLSVMFLEGASTGQQCWALVGAGIRMAQDVGAHRRKHDNKEAPTAKAELWKRAFWVLVSMDRMISSGMGRPCAIQDEDLDIDFPIECDDEYWDHPDPALRFKQPPNKPSYVTGFVVLLKLNQILTIILRTIYSTKKSKILLGFVGKQWEQHIVVELDSALNNWVDAVPDHLRWDPHRENVKFFDQSALLYCTYYYIQILIHRSFIPSPRKASPLSFPSLAICTNAARSCSHIVDVHQRRGLNAAFAMQMSTFISGIVLLLNIWHGKRSGLSTDPSRDMDDVHKCMEYLRRCETRWASAGRLWDILYELAFVGELPLPKAGPPAFSNKRDRDSDSPVGSGVQGTNTPTSSIVEGPQTTAGDISQTQTKLQPEQRFPYPLPVYSNDLGRHPVNSPRQSAGPAAPTQQQPFWSMIGVDDNSIGASVSPGLLYPPLAPAAPLRFDMDLYNQMGFNYEAAFRPGLPTPLMQVPHDGPSVGGASAMGIPQPTEMIGVNEAGLGLDIQELLNSDALSMWSNPPSGFDLDDWGAYLTNVSELTQGMNHAPVRVYPRRGPNLEQASPTLHTGQQLRLRNEEFNAHAISADGRKFDVITVQPRANLVRITLHAASNVPMLKPRRYVERLEIRVKKLEKVLTKLYPNSDILKELDAVVDIDAWLIKYLPQDEAQKLDSKAPTPAQSSRHIWEIAHSVVRNITQPVDSQPDDDYHVILSDTIQRLNLDDTDKDRFFGKSSGAVLVRTAMELKNQYTGGNGDVRRPIFGSRRAEFWISTLRFKQPPNTPSYVTGYVVFLKLNQVLTIILRTIYSTNKSNVLLGLVGKQWEQHVVVELDSALNKWVDALPDHLRWDPNRENLKFFNQSAALYSTYYYIQILIHRPFIPAPQKPSLLCFPSLAICTNAARSSIHIMDVYRRRGLKAPPSIPLEIFTSAIVLLLNIWNGKRSGLSTDPSRDMEDVHRYMESLREYETRDILYELAFVGDLPLPGVGPSAPSNKRDRDSDGPAESGLYATPSATSSIPEGPRTIAGARFTTAKTSQTETQLQLEQQTPYSLPSYSNDLGRLPVNSQSQSAGMQQRPFWSTIGVDENSYGSAVALDSSYSLPAPAASLPFDVDLYNQMGFNYETAFPPGLPTPSMQVPHVGPSVGGASAMGIPQPLEVIGMNEAGLGPDIQEPFNSDALSMWSNPPSGFDLDDWSTYLTNVSELTRGTNHAPPG
ncbi:hypothetical protein DXG01_003998 [Tephrocybe rancida]|nr:hypothetical protein DXG01_003998 [Tephrocybe rancida]